ncbi:MAG TPA: nuclease-related domain-containing protein, partial [Candidatus Methylomirabilis sp.]|nr:nuclease-related domain-containing protein [Candidatus Methylomirabilis sp.]
MLLKAPDDKSHLFAELERLATVASAGQKRQIAEEVRILRAGFSGERESVYLLDFYLKASRNTTVIHDLRLDLNGRVAQIDHVLLHRTLNVFVLETKHFQSGLKITEDGEFLRWNPSTKTYQGMPSPLAQNKRHIAVLRDAFDRIDLPTRLGVQLTPVFLSYVLVSPRAWIERPKRFDTSHILKADLFSVEEELNKRGFLK